MTESLKFESMEEALKYAIKQEELAAALYRHLAKNAKTIQAKEEFSALVEMEETHKKNLENFSFEEYEKKNKEVIYFNLGTTDFMPEPSDNQKLSELSYTDSLILAAKREEEAIQMYKKFAEYYKDNETLKKFFLNMVEEEKRHKYSIESKYEDVINER